MTCRILLIEDEPGLLLTLPDRLMSEGYSVESASDGENGLQRATAENFDLVILDVMLPKMNGFDVCREMRKRNIESPVLMLTAKAQTVDKVVGLKLGADDYLTKPFEAMELMARVEALLRRSAHGGPKLQRYRFGDITINFQAAEVYRNDIPVGLSAQEYKLLRYFIEHAGATLSRNELLDKVWGYDRTPATRTVDVHVSWLRQKLEPNPRHPQYIVTVHGLGYKFLP
jgi:two-component system, OmpR family, alkaline phosphatase synthesis response regulator PhoP